MESLDSAGMGLEFFEALSSDYFQALQPIGDASAVKLIEAWQFFLAGCHDHFAA
jgi:hypothetical protein